jgi:hypothetical protein
MHRASALLAVVDGSPLAASKYKRAALRSRSPPTVTPDVQMNFAVANILRIKGISQEDIDRRCCADVVDQFERDRLIAHLLRLDWTG